MFAYTSKRPNLRQSTRWNRWAAPQAPPGRTGLYRLTFMLPATLALLTTPGRHCPCLMGCLLTVERGGLITVDGTSREGVFEQTARFLRHPIRRNPPPPTSIASVLAGPGGRDSWNIVFGADVAFSPGGVEPYLPNEEEPAA